MSGAHVHTYIHTYIHTKKIASLYCTLTHLYTKQHSILLQWNDISLHTTTHIIATFPRTLTLTLLLIAKHHTLEHHCTPLQSGEVNGAPLHSRQCCDELIHISDLATSLTHHYTNLLHLQ